MKKTLLLLPLLALFCACSSSVDEPTNRTETVHLHFYAYEMEPLTKGTAAVSDYCTRLDIWLSDGTTTTAYSQVNEDAGFGSLNVELDKTKTYTLYAVAHKCTSSATLADGVISFPDDKVTHTMYATATFSPSTTTAVDLTMQRIVAQLRLETTDAVPTEAKKIRFTVSGVYNKWNVTSGPYNQLDRTSVVNITSTNNDGTATFVVYAIVTNSQTLHNVTIEALDANDAVLQSRTFTDVPLRAGYKTTYRGTFFIDTPVTAAFTCDDWNEYAVINF